MLNRWHNLSATKLLGCFLISLVAVFISNIYILSVILGCLLFSCIFLRFTWERIRPFAMLLGSTAILMLCLHILTDTFQRGVTVVLQFSLISLSSCLFISTTNELELIEMVEYGMRLTRKVGLKANKLDLALLLAIRSLSLIPNQFQSIRMAQKARGLDNHIVAVLMPLLIKVFRAADTITDALIARGYDSD